MKKSTTHRHKKGSNQADIQDVLLNFRATRSKRQAHGMPWDDDYAYYRPSDNDDHNVGDLDYDDSDFSTKLNDESEHKFPTPKKTLSKFNSKKSQPNPSLSSNSKFVDLYQQKLQQDNQKFMQARQQKYFSNDQNTQVNYPMPFTKVNSYASNANLNPIMPNLGLVPHVPGFNDHILKNVEKVVNLATAKIDEQAPIGGIGAGYAALDSTEAKMLQEQGSSVGSFSTANQLNSNFGGLNAINFNQPNGLYGSQLGAADNSQFNVDDFHNNDQYLNALNSYGSSNQNTIHGLSQPSYAFNNNPIAGLTAWLAGVNQEKKYDDVAMTKHGRYIGSFAPLSSRLKAHNQDTDQKDGIDSSKTLFQDKSIWQPSLGINRRSLKTYFLVLAAVTVVILYVANENKYRIQKYSERCESPILKRVLNQLLVISSAIMENKTYKTKEDPYDDPYEIDMSKINQIVDDESKIEKRSLITSTDC